MTFEEFLAKRTYDRIAARAGTSVPERTAFNVRSESKERMTVSISGVFDSYFGFDVREVRDEIESRGPKELTMLIESPGGSFVDGLALHAAVNRWRSEGMKVRAEAVGLVASAATLPYLAAGERVAHEGTMFMIHNVWTLMVMVGNAAELEEYTAKQVAVMRKMDDQNRAIVQRNTSLTRAQAVEALDAETWYDTAEMLETGICSEVIEPPDDGGDARNHAMDAARALWSEYISKENG